MKRKIIIIFIYDNKLYVSKDEKKDVIHIKDSLIQNGRISNVKDLIKLLKKSRLILSSLFKIVSDQFILVYFGNYNKYEIKNIIQDFSENGFDKVKLVDFNSIIDYEMIDSVIINSNKYYYVLNDTKKVIVSEELYNLEYAKSKIIIDYNTYNNLGIKFKKTHFYIVEDLPNYIIQKIAKRNFYKLRF